MIKRRGFLGGVLAWFGVAPLSVRRPPSEEVTAEWLPYRTVRRAFTVDPANGVVAVRAGADVVLGDFLDLDTNLSVVPTGHPGPLVALESGRKGELVNVLVETPEG